MQYKINTLCVQGIKDKNNLTGSITTPIYQTATFAHPSVGVSTGYDYSRLQNPTREILEKTVADLEGGYDCMAFSSGMAAVATLMELFVPGDHIIASEDLYGGSVRLFNHILVKNGIEIEYLDPYKFDSISSYVKENTKAVFIETPTNPMMHVIDIKAISTVTKKHNILLIVDNTFLTPIFQKPFELGADIVIHSGTKYLSGHNDVISGFLIVNSSDLSEKLRFIYKTTGASLSPFECFLVQRGIKTLAIRMERIQQNAIKLANHISNFKDIKKVHYVGLDNHPSYTITCKQSSGFGGMISFSVKNPKIAEHVLENVKLIQFAESLGGVESLITYPFLQTHADVPSHVREKIGIDDCLLRLSVGIEDLDDLIHDLEAAFNEI